MGYLLRTLILCMMLITVLTIGAAFHLIPTDLGHIQLALPTIVFTIFVQAFVMFYFIGVARLTEKINATFAEEKNSEENKKIPQDDINQYQKKLDYFIQVSTLSKRKVIPWVMIILSLGILGLLLGAAHHTGLVNKTTHSGVVLGFLVALVIGFVKQWIYLKKAHFLLRDLKALFSLSRNSM